MKDYRYLDEIKVASPCPALWSEMKGDAQKRFCEDCKLNVYNLSVMTRAEIDMLLQNSGERTCIRFYRRADGTLLTRDCPVGLAAVRRKLVAGWTWAAAQMLAVAGLALSPFLRPAERSPATATAPRPKIKVAIEPFMPRPHATIGVVVNRYAIESASAYLPEKTANTPSMGWYVAPEKRAKLAEPD